MTRLRRAVLFAVLMVAAAIMAPAAQAQGPACTITWTGAAGPRWFDMQPNDPSTTADDVYSWSQQRYPDNTDHACFPTGAVANTNQVTQNTPSVRSFAISAGATLSITEVQMGAQENSTNAGTLNMSGPVPLTINDANTGDGAEGLINTGTINFTSQGPANGQLAIIVAELFTNQGIVNVNDPEASIQRAGTGLSLDAVHSNQGTINISAGNALRSIFSNFINTGTITGAGSMNMDQDRFEAASGSQIASGTDVNMTNSIFAAAPGSTATGNVDIFGAFNGGGPSTLEGTVPAGITLDVEPGVTLRAPPVDTTVNAGRINLNGASSQLQVLPNDTGTNSTSRLTNAGTIEFVSGGAAGLRLITGDLVNQGTILVNHPEASFQFPGGSNSVPKLTNSGTVAVAPGSALRVLFATVGNLGGGTITVPAGAALNQAQDGQVGINNAGTFQVGGRVTTTRYAQDPSGTLTIGIAGTAPGVDFGQLIPAETATLAGVLRLETSGFAPAIGQQFKVIDASAPPTAPTIAGTFGALQEAGADYDVAYNATDVTLTAAAAGGPVSDPAACEKAKKKLSKAKKKLKKLQRNDAPKAKIKKAKKKAKKAKEAKNEACGG